MIHLRNHTIGVWTWPSWQLVGAVLGLDILATIFALFGWLSGPALHSGFFLFAAAPLPTYLTNSPRSWTDIVTIVRVWAFSFGVLIVISTVYLVLNRWTWLDNLGRKKVGITLPQSLIVHDAYSLYSAARSTPL
jgi:H+-transporting ATPase